MLEVKLHDIGEGMTEGDILHYFVKQGERVERDQPLIEVQTDKMTAELPSPGAGMVKEILIDPGTTVSVGTTLLVIETDETDAVQLKESTPETRPVSARVLATPFTRKLARENRIDIEKLKGSGPAGRVTDEDVLGLAAKQKQPEPVKVAPVAEKKRITKANHGEKQTIPFKGRRKQIAKKMVHSLKTIPHVTHFEEVDMTELMTFRKELKEAGRSISAAAFFIKAAAIALKDFPVFNAKLDEEQEVIVLESEYNIGLAVDSPDGLIVPVLQQVETKSILEIHKEMKELNEKARENRLSRAELTGGTFTISNVGPLGSIGATPVINHPETGLMAFHATKEKPVVRNGEIVIGLIMNVSMSFDHRVADGAAAVAFTNRFKELIEHPKLLIVELV
ncbi:2-oxo acid dehydrogenase subunit E2 [Metabacillus sp. KIGAM252]|uniref:Dihydrolipoamide acetyltransferase component of pyruvate dehydrogenase complex n=1 Tax=Metabacillus flavus TaxID=2823519 RepID=A0ABS5LAN4_9BACI|nr:dihydrolipoamide acetyltransferase family protein [Metabacillus flavus]MBS2967519.1 2-oxo acid dehydrogenase subunit E2 [Metabacillus flavus]